MFHIEVIVQAEGDKKSIYTLKEELLRVASQYNTTCRLETTSDEGFQESMSASFNPIMDVDVEDIVDMSLTGDERYELLIRKEEGEKS
jgi:hypothetical protein